MGSAEPHFMELPCFLEAEHPRFGGGGAHLQKEPASVAVISPSLRLIDSQRRQLSDCPCHPRSGYSPILLPILECRIVANDGACVKTNQPPNLLIIREFRHTCEQRRIGLWRMGCPLN